MIPARRAAAGRPRDVVFLKGEGSQAGSAYLRADQLCEIVAPDLGREGAAASVRTSARGVRDGLIVLHKTALTPRSDLAILLLKARGNVVACDFIDRAPESRICRLADVLIASSREQHRYFEAVFPGRPVVHIPHHADLRIAPGMASSSPVRAAYFGDPANALHLPELQAQGLCEMVAADRVEDAAWLGRLTDFRIHYAVRVARGDLRFKPFTKGAVAARAGAVIVTDRNAETEAALGPDYPFFPASIEYADVQAALEAAQRSVGQDAWRRAEAAMARLDAETSPEAVRAGFAELLDVARRRR